MSRYLTTEIKVFTWSKTSYQVSNYSPTTGTPSGLGALGQLLVLPCLVSHTRSKPMVWWSVSEKHSNILTLFSNWCKVSCGAGLINSNHRYTTACMMPSCAFILLLYISKEDTACCNCLQSLHFLWWKHYYTHWPGDVSRFLAGILYITYFTHRSGKN